MIAGSPKWGVSGPFKMYLIKHLRLQKAIENQLEARMDIGSIQEEYRINTGSI
jgi:hypothetical protein